MFSSHNFDGSSERGGEEHKTKPIIFRVSSFEERNDDRPLSKNTLSSINMDSKSNSRSNLLIDYDSVHN
jgi:hypothetical protein